MWVNFLFPPMCMFLLCKSITFHVPKSWDWNGISNSCAKSCCSGPNVISLWNQLKWYEKKTQSMERYVGKKKQWERNILVPRVSILLTSPMDWELRIMGKHSLYIHKIIYDALHKIRSTVTCSFQLWSHLELLIHGTGQKDENKKKSRKNSYDSGRKNYHFCKNMRYMVYTELNS